MLGLGSGVPSGVGVGVGVSTYPDPTMVAASLVLAQTLGLPLTPDADPLILSGRLTHLLEAAYAYTYAYTYAYAYVVGRLTHLLEAAPNAPDAPNA